MEAEHETPIQKILRENEARKVSQCSRESIEVVEKRLFNLGRLKTQLGLVSRNNIAIYQTKRRSQLRSNQFEQTKHKVNQLATLIRHSSNVVGA